MNRTKLKSYAPQARRDFIQAMTDRAAFYGLTAKKIEPVLEKGDVAVISGREHPRSVAKKRKALEARVALHGFHHTMEALAYTWFDRLAAIRFMELHGYLDHGYRVLSHPEGRPIPELLEHAEHVDMPGLKQETIIDLKLAGNREAELYRLLLIAQCNALSEAMPFLFEKIEDETELLLPDNLLHSDSLIRKLVCEIDEEDWQEVEIIGWLYQFYISEKKDEVIGKVVASEDIPAATQLFTPNWIVKYLVQNSLGRLWLATYPHSPLQKQMEYYVEPAQQTPDVLAQLKAITPTELNPEKLTLMDPAAGSGHILVEGYDLFKAIYQERGYRAKDIPRLILEKNLFGLEIDDRAAQLAAFALMMKARADDRRIFETDVKPNILAIQDSQEMNAADITHALNSPINKDELPPSEYLFDEIEHAETPLFSKKALVEKSHVSQNDIASLLELFQDAKTFGSLIQVPPTLATKLPKIEERLNDVLKHGDLTHTPAHVIRPLLQQARLLARQYDAVVANPPYMGGQYMNASLRALGRDKFLCGKSDLFAIFVIRLSDLVKNCGYQGLMTPFTWMVLQAYEPFRQWMLDHFFLTSLIQPEYHAFFDSAYVPICSFVIQKGEIQGIGTFIRLSDFYGEDLQPAKTLEAIRNPDCGWLFNAACSGFKRIPGSPIAYWVSERMRNLFSSEMLLNEVTRPRHGMSTGNNERFLRFWYEVSLKDVLLDCSGSKEAEVSDRKWFPYNKGGKFRKWYGNNDYVINWQNNGRDIVAAYNDGSNTGFRRDNPECHFKEGITWNDVTSGTNSFRYMPRGFLFDGRGSSCFPENRPLCNTLLGLLNSTFSAQVVQILNPTLTMTISDVGNIPLANAIFRDSNPIAQTINSNVEHAVNLARDDWDSLEVSWGFRTFPVLRARACDARAAFEQWAAQCESDRSALRSLEEENNRLFIEAYGLQGELVPEVPDDQITLYRPDREEDIKRLVSYAIGCMMGRYSLDKPGLIYAQSGDQGFDPEQYKTYRADDDGIIPLLETDWGIRDDATNRIVEFIGMAWPKEHLEENLKFIADSLGSNNGEPPRDTIRRYLATGFYKHHLSMYKKRPIYWLFSSGKQRAFQCLVYLHRYHEGTLARMRTEYVIPLIGKIRARMEQLGGTPRKEGQPGEREGGDIASATSTSQRRKLQKEYDELKKNLAELTPIEMWSEEDRGKANRAKGTFEEKLRFFADKKISLDLDDGVKVNYAKFGDLLAEVKAITGGKDEE